MPSTPQIDKGLIRTRDLLHELRADIDAGYAKLEENRQSQYLRRCVVRAIFSYIEALIESIKEELRSTVRTGLFTGELSGKETETLGPLQIIGRAKPSKFLPLDQNLKCTFRLAAKIWNLHAYRLSSSSQDFRDFLAAKSARNRLTHPRTYYDIEVTDYDMHYHTIAGMWIQSECQRLMDARICALAEGLPEQERAAFLERFK
jgi:hypothetical protein